MVSPASICVFRLQEITISPVVGSLSIQQVGFSPKRKHRLEQMEDDGKHDRRSNHKLTQFTPKDPATKGDQPGPSTT